MKNKIDNLVGWVLAILLAVMVFDVLWGVFTRYITGEQSSWTEELARFLLIWIGILGAAFATGKNIHISIDLLKDYLSDKVNRKTDILITAVIVLFTIAIFLIGGIRYVFISFKLGQTSPALGLPMGLVYSIFPISGLLIIYYRIHNLLKDKWK